MTSGRILRRPYLDVRSLVGSSDGEQGLLGLAFAPNRKGNSRLYFTYIDASGTLVLARVQAAGRHQNVAARTSVRTVLRLPHPTYQNHNGGSLTFGKDGLLHLGTGDGGGAGDPSRKAQNPKSLYGKILRLDVTRPCGKALYCVPRSNPFPRATSKNQRLVWALGARNPWRVTTDAETGMIWIGDVGQGKWEEVDVLSPDSKAANLGWSCFEGNVEYNADQCPGVKNYVAPVATLCHPDEIANCPSALSGESITGGYVYRGSTQTAMIGTYVFADFVVGNIYAYRDGTTAKVGDLDNITSFGQTNEKELVAVTYSGGLYRLNASAT